MKYRKGKNSKPIPVLLDEALLARIARLSERMGEAKSTVMRITMRLGLDGLEKTFAENPAALTIAAVRSATYPEQPEKIVDQAEDEIVQTIIAERDPADGSGTAPPGSTSSPSARKPRPAAQPPAASTAGSTSYRARSKRKPA